MRKQLQRNNLKFAGDKAEEINDYVEKMMTELVDKFADVDANDLYLITVRVGGYVCTMANLKDTAEVL